MIGHLAGARVRSARNALRASPGARWHGLLLATLAIAGVAGVWAASAWFFERCLEFEPIGPLVIRRALSMVLLLELSLLAFSALVTAFAQLYLADDLEALLTYPIPTDAMYTVRFVETAAISSWMVVPFGLPVFITAGLALDGSFAYWWAVAIVTAAWCVLPTAAGVAASLVATSLLSARRARHAALAAGSAAVAVIAVIVRGSRPERLVDANERLPLLEALASLEGLDPAWLPHSWALDALSRGLGPRVVADTHPLALLVTASAAAFFVTGWLFRALWPRAVARSRVGLHREWTGVGGGRRFATLAPAVARLDPAHQLVAKDRRVFVRDTTQWSQALILVAVVIVYVLNFSSLRAATGTGLLTALGLHLLNLGLAGFVVLALGARFVFPAVSLEGPAFWLVRTAPLDARSYLRAKMRTWRSPMVLFAVGLVLLTQHFLGGDWLDALVGMAVVIPLTAGLVALGTGLGARFPRFDATDPAAVATGFGGLAYMLAGGALVVVTVLAATAPTAVALRTVRHAVEPGAIALTAAVAGAAAVVLLPWIAGRLALGSGAARLDRGSDATD